MSKKTGLIILSVVSLALLVLFLVLPKQPSSAREKANAPMDSDSLRLAQAIELVNGPNPMEGITILRDLVKKDSTNVEVQYWLGVFAAQSQQVDKAIARFNTVLTLDPTYLAAYIDRGGVYAGMGDTLAALRDFRKVVELDSTNNFGLLFSGQTEEMLGMYAEAKQHYEQLLRHNSDTIVVKRVKEYISKIETKLNP
jgi:cytochrome c-type biogenesis protein CcmH/NrfG